MSDEQLQSTAPEQATAADSGADRIEGPETVVGATECPGAPGPSHPGVGSGEPAPSPTLEAPLVEHADLELTGFTPREAMFVREYLVDLNATQAAIRAGYSKRSARDIAAELLGKDRVKRAVHLALDARARRTQISADRALVEAARIAFCSVDDFAIDECGNVAVKEGRTPGAMAAVARIKRKTRTITRGDETEVIHEVELALWDKNAALEKVLRHTKALPPERMELTGAGGGPVQHEHTHRGTIEWAGKTVTL